MQQIHSNQVELNQDLIQTYKIFPNYNMYIGILYYGDVSLQPDSTTH